MHCCMVVPFHSEKHKVAYINRNVEAEVFRIVWLRLSFCNRAKEKSDELTMTRFAFKLFTQNIPNGDLY